ncbi:thioredoxin-like domain-containing protein [Baffinella frigidus]|nr:thioredoxin-like domain-containing protein [Cryptophyta sp. CCMP2293]
MRGLVTVPEVEAFSEAHNVSVVGFFGGGGGEDEEEEFAEAAETLRFAHSVHVTAGPEPMRLASELLSGTLRFAHNVHVAAVRAKAVVAHFIDARWVKRAPSVVVTRNFDKGEKDRDAVLMTELPDESVERWISKRTVRLVDEVTGQNFAYYESLRLPMLLLFVNKTVDNSAILKLYKQAAKDYQGQISFVSIDGVLFASRKLALGLVDDVLPAMAMNTLDGALYPYPTHQRIDLQGRIDLQAVSSFARGFLGG